jgi:N-acetylneuraminic acid mutarotase
VDGVDVNRNGATEHWILNPSDSNPQWTDATSVDETSNHTAAVILNGDIVIVGGQTTSDDSTTTAHVWEWDPNNPGQWTALASMPYAVSHAVVAVIDDRIVVAGGTTKLDQPLDSVIVYDPTTNTWSSQTSLPDGRLAAVGGVIGNEIIIATGFGDGNLQAQTWAAIAT